MPCSLRSSRLQIHSARKRLYSPHVVQAVPAVGNVGQLGVDIQILHTAAKRCAILNSADVLPVAGRGAFGSQGQITGLVTSLEVFRAEKEGVRCFFLQQRGPVVTGRYSLALIV